MSKENVRIPGKMVAVAGDMVMGVVYVLQDAVWVVENVGVAILQKRGHILRNNSMVGSSRKKN